MSKPTFEQRCLLAEQCLPDAPYRDMLKKLHAEMLEALAEQPARPYRLLQDNGSKYFGESWDKAEQPAQQALDKKAENARELGLDYEPAQQEPVAWKNAALRVGEDLCSVGPFGYYDMTAEQWLDWALSVVTVHVPPAQRTWVGLTDEEKRQLFERDDYQGWLDYINAIEAKLKEKNT